MSDLFEDISPDDFEAPDGVSWREWVRPVETVNKRLVSGEQTFYWEPNYLQDTLLNWSDQVR